MQQRVMSGQICVTIAHKFVLFSIIAIYIFWSTYPGFQYRIILSVSGLPKNYYICVGTKIGYLRVS